MKKHLICTFVALSAFAVQADETMIRHQLTADEKDQQFRIIAKKPEHFNRCPSEKASVKASCDKKFLRFSVSMADNDIICEATKNQDSLKNFGDAIQIFVKSEKDTFIWEFQIAPNGKKSCFFHMGPGRMFYPEAGSKFPDYTVKNTISNGKWEMVAEIPLEIFKEKGFKFTDDEKWTAIVVRHNFSRYHNERETSSYPQTIGNVANPDYYAELILK